jgi:hypothetical protein
MKMSWFRYIFFFLILALLITLLYVYGCNNNPKFDTYWFQDPNGFFHTNDVKQAQEEIPFNIIIPSYLPEDIDLNMMEIYGPIKRTIGDHVIGIEVDITYVSEEYRILIYEDNTGAIVNPNPELEQVVINIAGEKVLQQVAQALSASGIEEGIRFDWNYKELSFTVKVYGLTEDEGIKIIESMIKQLG